jgi:hypothetical protein
MGEWEMSTSTEVGIERLERLARLADFLEKEVDPKRYNIRLYANTTDAKSPSFVGCALGHSTRLFAKDGFRIINLGDEYCPYHTLAWKGNIGWIITEDILFKLFMPSRDLSITLTPSDTARRIREYISSTRPPKE